MRHVLSALMLWAVAASAGADSATWEMPRTGWGDPDLSGIWSNETLTPFERREGDPEFISPAAAQAAREAIQQARAADARPRESVTAPPAGGNVGGYNLVWIDAGSDVVSTGRSSLVISHGGIVPVRAEALAAKQQAEQLATGDMEHMSPWDRCITRGMPAGMFQAGYNNYYRIEQRPEAVLIYYEMIHEARIIPIDGRARVGGGLQFWNGEPRGYWEGDTLVVESHAFKPGWIATSFSQGRIKGVAHTSDLRLVERFTRVNQDTIVWQATITDPEVYTDTWTVEMPMVDRHGSRIFEYACHEGNQAVGNILRGARVQERGGLIVPRAEGFANLVPADARIEKLAGGFQFTEGPVWWRDKLFFSDIPGDTVYSWSSEEGVQTFIQPVFLPQLNTGGVGGSNGLSVDPAGRLVLAEHGNRRLAMLNDAGSRVAIAQMYNGRRLNSPNDMVWHSSGAVFFTDPPYGLPGLEQSDAAEQGHNGVYRLDPDGTVSLLATQTRPNGIGLSPDERTLYVANSDQAPHKLWFAYDVQPDLTLSGKRVFHDANTSPEEGVPDGLAVDEQGNVFATGPGGVWVFAADGTLLGKISPPERPANVGFGEDGRTLFMTARTGLYRIRLASMGLVR